MKILVVDDSIVYRTAITQALAEVPGHEVVSSVSNGQVAVEFIKKNPGINLITLDMEMPIMGGLETIKEIRKFNKDIVIVVFSSVTLEGAEKTIEALNLGADDFVTKIQGSGTIEDSLAKIREVLLPKIEGFSTRRVGRGKLHTPLREENLISKQTTNIEKIVSEMSIKPKLILIGSSTGGPEALTTIFRKLNHLTIPILIAQHMPPLFTEKMAKSLDAVSEMVVTEAKGGEVLKPGHCYIAPGDFHMVLNKDRSISLNKDEKRHFVRPAVDVLLESVAENFNEKVLLIVLTGMGEDGALGAKKLEEKGAYLFIQDESTSVVWGMPGAVSRLCSTARELPINEFNELLNTVSKRI